MITYILLLGAALYHGLYGLRTILFELTLSRALEKPSLSSWPFPAWRSLSMAPMLQS